MQCKTVIGDAGGIYPAQVDRKDPGETILVEYDLSEDIDCENIGITISTSTWDIHADDDDAALTLGVDTVDGLTTSVLVSGGTDGANYRLINTITTSDNRVLLRVSSIPVLATRAVNN